MRPCMLACSHVDLDIGRLGVSLVRWLWLVPLLHDGHTLWLICSEGCDTSLFFIFIDRYQTPNRLV